MITLKTLPQATAQEVFDQMKNHLIKQNKKSMVLDPNDNRELCSYRGDGGLQCAAGCLIADDEYNPEWEHTAWCSLTKQKKVPNKHEKMINKLQSIHDLYQPNQWQQELKDYTLENNLQYHE